MGFFSATCSICGKKTGLGRYHLPGGIVCKDCFKKAGYNPFSPMPTKDEVEMRIKGLDIVKTFKATHRVLDHILVNKDEKTWYVYPAKRVYKFDELVDYEIIQNGSTVSSKGIGKAVAGGLVFGGVGAIVGGVTAKAKTSDVLNELKIKVVADDFDHPDTFIDLLLVKPLKNQNAIDAVMKVAQNIVSLLDLIKNSQNNSTNEIKSETISEADEILKFKELLDKGIITEEEFQAKKRQILGI